jgi:hypothetical protein
MKKLLVFVFVCLLFVSLIGCSQTQKAPASSEAPATTSIGLHTHQYTAPANCQEKAVCKLCGKEGRSGPHSFVGGTCVVPPVCEYCGAQGTAPGHQFEGGTCVEPAVCRICGEKGDLKEHSFTGGDCKTPSVCSVCGAEGPLGDHQCSDATCLEPSVCTVCGLEIRPALGHNLSAATCTEPAKCSRCGYTEGEPLGHEGIGVCARCKQLGTTVFSGKGDRVVSGVNLPTGGICVLDVTHDGSRNFIVHTFDANGDKDYFVNEIGNYTGRLLAIIESPVTFEITADGNWSFEIKQLEESAKTSFSGHGDDVLPILTCGTGTWAFTHNGSRNFIVHSLTTDGVRYLINEIGAYSGEKYVVVPAGSNLSFEINADGDWTIEKVG